MNKQLGKHRCRAARVGVAVLLALVAIAGPARAGVENEGVDEATSAPGTRGNFAAFLHRFDDLEL